MGSIDEVRTNQFRDTHTHTSLFFTTTKPAGLAGDGMEGMLRVRPEVDTAVSSSDDVTGSSPQEQLSGVHPAYFGVFKVRAYPD